MDTIGNTIGLAILTEYMFSYVRDLGSSHTRVFSYSCFLILSYYHSSHYLVPDSPAFSFDLSLLFPLVFNTTTYPNMWSTRSFN